MKKYVIWFAGFLLTLLSGFLMWHSFIIAVDEMGKTIDNVSVAFIGCLLFCAFGLGFCIILNFIILFLIHRHLHGNTFSIRNFLIARNDTAGIKAVKIIGYLFILLYFCDIVHLFSHSVTKGGVLELVAMLLAIVVTGLFLIWLSLVSKHRVRPTKPAAAVAITLLMLLGPVLLSPATERFLLIGMN